MAGETKDKGEISDITEDKELNEKDLQDVNGGLLIKRTFGTKDDCGGNCMGTVSTAVGQEVDV